jgi:DNA excision repair protein ERCC-2
MSQTGKRYEVSLKCLDPALYTGEVFSDAHSTILMSGTLVPLDMYKEVLGVKNSKNEEYRNPFPPENRLTIITHGITTRFTKRDEYMWRRIAGTLNNVVRQVPGNMAAFFPSYDIMGTVAKLIKPGSKELLLERQEMTKTQRHVLYKRLEELQTTGGGLLLGVQAGSFSEGLDFPGGMLDCVAVVGLPLERPTLEVEALIKYYDFRFNRGWDYGYIYPAMNKALQAAGRCIRSEKDRGVILLMDDRFKWENYQKCFPKDMNPLVTERPEEHVAKFFTEK